MKMPLWLWPQGPRSAVNVARLVSLEPGSGSATPSELERDKGVGMISAAEACAILSRSVQLASSTIGSSVGSLQPSRTSALTPALLLLCDAQARALKHTLSLASTAAQRRLSRAETLSSTFSSLLHRDSDGGGSSAAKLPLVPSSLAVSSRALHISSTELLSALEDLRAEDALGAPLAKPQNGKAWTGGRDRFVAWEANKLVREHKMGEGGKEAKEKRGAEEKGGARKKRG